MAGPARVFTQATILRRFRGSCAEKLQLPASDVGRHASYSAKNDADVVRDWREQRTRRNGNKTGQQRVLNQVLSTLVLCNSNQPTQGFPIGEERRDHQVLDV